MEETVATGAAQTILSPEEYISFERKFVPDAETVRHEYVKGKIISMSGASRAHNLISFNIAAELHPQIRDREIEVYIGEMRVGSPTIASYFYPDIVVVSQEPEFEDDVFDTLRNPIVIIEILSPSTEAFDRGEKFSHYRQIESLQEYIIVSQDKVNVERFLRKPDEWGYTSFQDINQQIPIASIACELSLEKIYERVTFPD
ncbi:Uma2 family endonuclease [Candidatus Poribacteria bacterium]|nr:Uma2 family endonuclease [Candidatus Poribacteria bacterium]MYB63418.1 Uma2 family endonuclease [Candidatus Poribacteria bacterium]MYF56249.1 Uma2 family endonuclease [Candidatus Poribacteria bacterium]